MPTKRRGSGSTKPGASLLPKPAESHQKCWGSQGCPLEAKTGQQTARQECSRFKVNRRLGRSARDSRSTASNATSSVSEASTVPFGQVKRSDWSTQRTLRDASRRKAGSKHGWEVRLLTPPPSAAQEEGNGESWLTQSASAWRSGAERPQPCSANDYY